MIIFSNNMLMLQISKKKPDMYFDPYCIRTTSCRGDTAHIAGLIGMAEHLIGCSQLTENSNLS